MLAKRKYQPLVCYLLSAVMIFSLMAASITASSLSKYGSTGSEVTAVQKRLSELGYYSGNIDGIFGSDTKTAVIKFQKDNKLTADGIVGEKL